VYQLILTSLIAALISHCSQESNFRGRTAISSEEGKQAATPGFGDGTETQSKSTPSLPETIVDKNTNNETTIIENLNTEETSVEEDAEEVVEQTPEADEPPVEEVVEQTPEADEPPVEEVVEETPAAEEEVVEQTPDPEPVSEPTPIVNDPLDDGKLTCIEAAFTGGVTSPKHYCTFVSRYGYYGNLGGLQGADAKCTQMAEEGGLTDSRVSWKAILSDNSTHAKDRVKTDKNIYSTYMGDGKIFSYYLIASANQFWNSPAAGNRMIFNQFGYYDAYKEPETNHGNHTWTSTRSSGTNTAGNCYNWTSNFGAGHVGDATVGGEDSNRWFDGGSATQSCSHRNQIYCISQ